ncbi:GNAT family N-acetyltransferase [Bacillus massiliigorillae]|uniref:GNAT family N-acetyltransferase n=1 Tax=Bacillus massiliigorillae TaxID=1243664 RepID=UPI0003A76BF6|nr:GNAT family N-acetyltransferase [Bacillus massiliigorillae]
MAKGIGTIELVFYEEKYKEKICNYQLDEIQRNFTTLPCEALTSCENDAFSFPIVILKDEQPIGFFVLQAGEAIRYLTELDNMMLIRSVSVNPSFQGLGYAQDAMKLLPEFVKKNYPGVLELFLIVNFKNKRAEHVYIKAGYIDRGIRRQDPSGFKKILHYVLH